MFSFDKFALIITLSLIPPLKLFISKLYLKQMYSQDSIFPERTLRFDSINPPSISEMVVVDNFIYQDIIIWELEND